MALIADDHPAAAEDSGQFWKDELKNSQILIHEIDKAILALTKKDVQSYDIDTGQTRWSVTRNDLTKLSQTRAALLKQVQEAESKLGIDSGDGGGIAQVVPTW
jgi:hypothetical protein